MFGHAIPFNFNKKGATHGTMVGGSVSILLKLFLFVFLLDKTVTMLHRADNKIESHLEPTDFDSGTVYNITDEEIGFLPIVFLSAKSG